MDATLSINPARPENRLLTGEKQATKAARDFEAVFLSTVINPMLKDCIPETMSGGHGEEAFLSLFGDAIAQQIVASGGIGIAESVEKRLAAYGRK
jgi:flagellar protein FlgJ